MKKTAKEIFNITGKDAPTSEDGIRKAAVKKILDEMKDYIMEKYDGFSPDDIQNTSSFKYDLGFDSLDTLEIVMDLEATFDIDASPEFEGKNAGNLIELAEAFFADVTHQPKQPVIKPLKPAQPKVKNQVQDALKALKKAKGLVFYRNKLAKVRKR